VKVFMGQTHQDYTCNTQEELSHEIIMERVMGYSGSGSKVIDKGTGRTTLKTQVGGAGKGSSVSSKREAADQLTFHPDVPVAIRDVKGNHSGLSWVVITYEDSDSSLLVVRATGEGEDNAAALAEHLSDDNVAYCLIRKTEQIDNSLTAKFVYIRWIGNNIPRMQKARLGTHAGDIYNLFAPTHTSLDTPDLHEINDENIMKQIMIASGTYKHVLDKHPAQHQPQQPRQGTPKPAPRTTPRNEPKDTHGGVVKTIEKIVDFIDEAGIRQAIQDVRNDNTETNWVLITYDAPQSKTLRLVGAGDGGLSEMKTFITPELVMYGLYRTIERVDESITVKFTFIDWRGENIHRMQRAKLGTHSGAIREIFQPFHVDILASQDDELTEELIEKKVRAASGTAYNVL